MEPIVEYDAEHMKKGGKVKKKKPQGNQTQTVNVYVTKRMSQPRAKQAKQVQQQLPPGVPMSMLSNLANFPFARQDPGFVRMGDIRPSLNQSYDSSEYLPNRPVKLTQSQLNKPIELNNQMQNFPKQKVIALPLKGLGSMNPLPAFQPQPPPRVIPGLFDRPPGEEDVKLQERYREEEELKEALKAEMEEKEEKEEKEPIMQELIGAGEVEPVEQRRNREDDRIAKLRVSLNKMQLQPKEQGRMGLRKYAREMFELTIPRDASKAQVIDLIIQYAIENPDVDVI